MKAIHDANDVGFSFPYDWPDQYLNQSSRALPLESGRLSARHRLGLFVGLRGARHARLSLSTLTAAWLTGIPVGAIGEIADVPLKAGNEIALEPEADGIMGKLAPRRLNQLHILRKLIYEFVPGEDNEATRQKIISTIPLGRLSRPLDIAKACAFLASDEADFITGVCLEVSSTILRLL